MPFENLKNKAGQSNDKTGKCKEKIKNREFKRVPYPMLKLNSQRK